MLRFQGTITSLAGAPVEEGNHDFDVRICDASCNTVYYQQSVTAEVSGGAYTLVLSRAQAGALNAAFTEGPRYLEITVVSGPSGPIGETLQPLQQIASVPFALNASGASGSWSPGDIKIAAYDPTSPPEGWLNCNGDVYDGALPEYADLYAAIGTAFNTGGETGDQFRVPDLRGRFPAGYHFPVGDAEGDFAAIGETGGNKSHDHGGVTAVTTSHSERGTQPDMRAAHRNHTHPINADTHVPPYVTLGFLVKY
jgi:microcystin-dependent protein